MRVHDISPVIAFEMDTHTRHPHAVFPLPPEYHPNASQPRPRQALPAIYLIMLCGRTVGNIVACSFSFNWIRGQCRPD